MAPGGCEKWLDSGYPPKVALQDLLVHLLWGVRAEESEVAPSHQPDPLELPFTEMGKVGRCFLGVGETVLLRDAFETSR